MEGNTAFPPVPCRDDAARRRVGSKFEVQVGEMKQEIVSST
jgi:hypothetical protein